jgi:hypothetical protein
VNISRDRLYIKSHVSEFDEIYLSNSGIGQNNHSELRIIN